MMGKVKEFGRVGKEVKKLKKRVDKLKKNNKKR